ncbi:hypothetical protein TWF718_008644 [Orbilia javanica]|uniref:Uncharacterized protein n=1 Tax=Orbilia javanica TaxID=47235 RepID=A0AAN8MTI3_9PEZI
MKGEKSLKSSTAEIWLEKCTDPVFYGGSNPPTRRSRYEKIAIHSASKSTELSDAATFPAPITYKVREGFVESSPESYYRLKLHIPKHWNTYCVQIIIDGVEQRAYVENPQYFRSVTYPVSARRTNKRTYRHFQFSELAVKGSAPGFGNYDFKHFGHCENGYVDWFKQTGDIGAISYMIGPQAVGSIRVNFYKAHSCEKMSASASERVSAERNTGDGDWNPCQSVDDIGAYKLGAGVKNVTTLGPEFRGSEPDTWYHIDLDTWHPFETFVFKYRPYSVLAENNLLAANSATGYQKFANSVKNVFSLSKKLKKSEESKEVESGEAINEKEHMARSRRLSL